MCKLKLLVMDVDGTLTDGKIYIGAEGELMKAFHVKDGYGITTLLPTIDITPMIITGRKSTILKRRCEELGIDLLIQGVSDKRSQLRTMTTQMDISMDEVAYMGDDLNDLDCMKDVAEKGGMIACPSDAVEAVRATSHYVCEAAGGNGAVREFIDYLCKQNGEFNRGGV